MRHHTLADLLNAFISTGLVIERVAEPGVRPLPVTLAIPRPQASGPSEPSRNGVARALAPASS